MKIYIAAKFSQRHYLRGLLYDLRSTGIIVQARWLTDDLDFSEQDDITNMSLGLRDLCDIRISDVVVLDTTGELAEGAGGGREFEAGFGLARKGEFWRVGPARSVFHHMAKKSWLNWETFIKEMMK